MHLECLDWSLWKWLEIRLAAVAKNMCSGMKSSANFANLMFAPLASTVQIWPLDCISQIKDILHSESKTNSQTHRYKPGIAFGLISVSKRTAVRPKGFFFTPLPFFRISPEHSAGHHTHLQGGSHLWLENRYKNTVLRSDESDMKRHSQHILLLSLYFTKRLWSTVVLICCAQ